MIRTTLFAYKVFLFMFGRMNFVAVWQIHFGRFLSPAKSYCHRLYVRSWNMLPLARKPWNYFHSRKGLFRITSFRTRQHRFNGHRTSRKLNSKITLYRKMPLKTMSRWWGQINQVDIPVFLRKPLLGLYVWMFSCNIQEAAIEDLKSYRNLSEFFRRSLKPEMRPIEEHIMTCPSDGKVLHCGRVEHGLVEQVKGVQYSLNGFLGPPNWIPGTEKSHEHLSDADYHQRLGISENNDLFYTIVYLAPGDYHRFHSPTKWTVNFRRHFPGELLSVNPGIARWIQGLFNFNERVVYYGNWKYGLFTMTAVGATNVGSIKIYFDDEVETNLKVKHPPGTYFDRVIHEDDKNTFNMDKGDQFGEFNLGSTVVLIFEAPKSFHFQISPGQRVQVGQGLGQC